MSPDEIRRSWDDDDTPRSVFPEPLAERLTRENKELRAEVEDEHTNHMTYFRKWQRESRRADALVADLRGLADDLAEFATNGEVSSGIAMGWREGVRIAEHNVRTVLDKHAGEQP